MADGTNTLSREVRAQSMRDTLGIDALDDAANGLLAEYLLAICPNAALLQRILREEHLCAEHTNSITDEHGTRTWCDVCSRRLHHNAALAA